MNEQQAIEFLRESNKIEGIFDEPTERQVGEFLYFLELESLEVRDVVRLTTAFQPDAKPRFWPGFNVEVGVHIPPPGGVQVEKYLNEILTEINEHRADAYHTHIKYEKLHPFTDGNGRSGRAIWAWQMMRTNPYRLGLGFLHAFYYQTLNAASYER